VPLITLRGISAPVFVSMVHYVYQNSAQLTESTVLDVLYAADMCLLPGLKRLCGGFLATLLDTENVLAVLRTARLFQLPKLEDACTRFIAENLDQMVEGPELARLVCEDASSVRERQATDSIGVVDDVRYHITSAVQTFSEMAEASERLRLMDQLLDRLGLGA